MSPEEEEAAAAEKASKKTVFKDAIKDMQEDRRDNFITHEDYAAKYAAAYLAYFGTEANGEPPDVHHAVVALKSWPQKSGGNKKKTLEKGCSVDKPAREATIKWRDPAETVELCRLSSANEALQAVAEFGFDGYVRSSPHTSLRSDASGKPEDGTKIYYKGCTGHFGCGAVAAVLQDVTVDAEGMAKTEWVGVASTRRAHSLETAAETHTGIKFEDLKKMPEYEVAQVRSKL